MWTHVEVALGEAKWLPRSSLRLSVPVPGSGFTYKVDRMYFNGGSYRVVFHDRDGFVRDLPLALFVDITPAWVDGWEPQSVRNHTRYVRA
jgi:hypothetical protein